MAAGSVGGTGNTTPPSAAGGALNQQQETAHWPYASENPSPSSRRTARPFVSGKTCARQDSAGTAHDWTLRIKGRQSITIRDTHWNNGERDIRSHLPDVAPAMPKALVSLHGRRRASVYKTGDGQAWMPVWIVRPDSEDWPRHKKSITVTDLDEICGRKLIKAARAEGITELGTKQQVLGTFDRTWRELCAQFSPANEAAPVTLYVVTRIAPTLKHIGWL